MRLWLRCAVAGDMIAFAVNTGGMEQMWTEMCLLIMNTDSLTVCLVKVDVWLVNSTFDIQMIVQ